ncbi:MAG: hypothetical protein AAGC73_07155 [Verrucomicrobiota bacterium]
MNHIDPNKIKITKLISALWFLWALLHIIPGTLSMMSAVAGDITSLEFLFPDTNPKAMTTDYPREVEAILVTFGQHGFNLFWFGLVTLVCSVWIWVKQSGTAMLLAAVVGGLADLGALFAVYMIGRIDIWGLLIFAGTLLAIVLSGWIWTANRKQ